VRADHPSAGTGDRVLGEDPVVVLAATIRPWAAALRAHAADHGGVIIRATVLTDEDALAEHASVVLVDEVTSFLTPAFVARLHDRGRAVLGVYDPADAQGKGDLVDAGVDALVPSDATAEDLVAHVRHLVAIGLHHRPAATTDAPPRTPAAWTGSTAGRIVGVTGPPGGVGVTEITIELAAALGARDVPTVMVDVDEVAPSHAQRLGLALHPNLHTALDEVQRAQPVSRCIHRLGSRRPIGALPGMVVADNWSSVAAGAPMRLLTSLADAGRTVVADLGHSPATVEGGIGRRFGHARSIAARCDDLIVVCAPSPTSVTRTIGLIADLPRPRRLQVVLNRTDGDRFARDESIAELRRALRLPSVLTLPEDRRVAHAAWQGGRVARGRFTAAVSELAAGLMAAWGGR
jgi:MinD-like ATPase involved in chromosome partitioning or flagellar assembly